MGWVSRWLPGENHANQGKHRTEVTEVTEGETGGGKLGWVSRWLPGENHANQGKHRTEVTEATEGEPEEGSWVGCLGGFRARTTPIRESIAQRSQRPQRGNRRREIGLGESVASERTALIGESIARAGLAIDQAFDTVLKACFTEID